MNTSLKTSSPTELKLHGAPEVGEVVEKSAKEEIVFVRPPTEKLSPFRNTNAGAESEVGAIHNPTLFELVMPPGPTASVAMKATPAG